MNFRKMLINLKRKSMICLINQMSQKANHEHMRIVGLGSVILTKNESHSNMWENN